MSWPRFFIALLAVFLVQTTLARLVPGAGLDLFLALALFVALTMPAADGRIAACLAGYLQSIGSDGPLGLHALSLGGAAWAATVMRAQLNTRSLFPRFTVAVLAAVVGQLVLRVTQTLILGHAAASFGAWLQSIVVSSLVAAFLAALLAGGRPFARVVRRDYARRI
ncbi:MAG: hypothetical protein SF069_02665 [Phycisphaerae bacterium]|nr:hypothetical protein [Phycisphaerae bacterium]